MSAELALFKAGMNPRPCEPHEKSNLKQPTQACDRIPSLDGLRGLSIWSVLLAHASSHFDILPFHGRFTHTLLANLSYFGVTVFFVISGYLITHLLMRERARRATISLWGFYRRRAVRILPAFLVYTGAILLVGRATPQQAAYAFTFTTSYFFVHAYLPLQQLWSLSVEEQFYLLWPVLLLNGAMTARRCCWAALALCPVLRLLLRHTGYNYSQYNHMAPAIADSIAAGCLLAIYYDRLRFFARRYLMSSPVFLAVVCGAVVLAEAVYRLDLVLLWGAVPCLIALIIPAAVERKDPILNRGPLVWSGILSYSLYLWQQPFLVWSGPMNYLSVRLPLAFAAAYLSYRFVEQPLLRAFSPSSRRTAASTSNSPLVQELTMPLLGQQNAQPGPRYPTASP